MQNFVPVLNENMSKEQANMLNPLVLAFVGDSVQTLYVRTKLVFLHDSKPHNLHNMASSEVKATAQAKVVQAVMEQFTEDEMAVYKRARNSKIHTSAKNAGIIEYKKASGFEAVLGFLYLTNNNDRLKYFLEWSEINE
ncbi:MAG: ribonuclease III domain-containing protein [Clostridia bacterium]